MMRKFSAVAVALVLTAGGAGIAEAFPTSTTFTARLADDGVPVEGSVTLTLALYAAASGGTGLWSETQAAQADNGLISVAMGGQTPLELATFDGQDLWLEVTVNGTVLSPRSQIRAVPYALVADTAQHLGSLGPTDVAEAGHTHAAGDITSGTLDNTLFSAYSNLTDDGRLDNDTGTDLLTRDQADARYVGAANVTSQTFGTTLITNVNGYTANTAALDYEICSLSMVRVDTGGYCQIFKLADRWEVRAYATSTGGLAQCSMTCLDLD